MDKLEVGQYVKVTLPNELKATGEYKAPYYSGVGELEAIATWDDKITRYCVRFTSKGSVWFTGDVITPDTYAGMTHTLKYQWAAVVH